MDKRVSAGTNRTMGGNVVLTILLCVGIVGLGAATAYFWTQKAGTGQELSDCRSRLTQSQDQSREADRKIQDLTRERDDLLAEKKKLSRELERLETRAARLELELNGLKGAESKRGEKLSQELDGLEKTIQDLRTERDQQAEELEKLKSEIAARDEEKERLGREMRKTYEGLISELKGEIEEKHVAIRKYKERVEIDFVDKILFDTGSVRISPRGQEVLAKAKSLALAKDKFIYVLGHTDDVPIKDSDSGYFPTNWELSAARASAVVRFLVRRAGIAPERAAVVGRSFYQPAADNKTEKGRAQNRRVEIIVAGDFFQGGAVQ